MKIGPFSKAIDRHNENLGSGPGRHLDHFLVHTGQHYDESMSSSFFDILGIPEPNVNLEVGSGTHAEQVGRTMIAFERVVRDWRPDWVVVVGDVNATCACSITAKKENLKLAHIESGLRSFDWAMPEEINRLVTDRLADLHFTPDRFADANLLNEGVASDKIHCVGNIMIDSFVEHTDRAKRIDLDDLLHRNQLEGARRSTSLSDGQFAVLTVHRPSNVDAAEILGPLVDYLVSTFSKVTPIVWALHPRTLGRLREFGLWEQVKGAPGIHLINPVSYLDMLRLNLGAKLVLTDSGGIQEECCVTGTPCITLRENTERPITLAENGGVSYLAGNDVAVVSRLCDELIDAPRSPLQLPLWDGRTADRIVKVLGALTD
jgi:UDP-N-acetylglucosamine 2-epimerase (non-hydrolysing)